MQVGDQYIATSITVLEQKTGPQCIFGLDNMRRHQCQIDLKDNVLRILSCRVELPFIPQHLVSDSFNVERQVSAEQVRSCCITSLHMQVAFRVHPIPGTSHQRPFINDHLFVGTQMRLVVLCMH